MRAEWLHAGAASPIMSGILRRPLRSPSRILEESSETQWSLERRVLAEKAAKLHAAERERERWGHQHEFDREEMQHRLNGERESHLALKARAEEADRQLEAELSRSNVNFFAKDFEAVDNASAARREETRRAMEENARLMRERLEVARASKLTEIVQDAAQGEEFLERFTKPSWREQAKRAKASTQLSGVLPTHD